jgi:ATP-dependent DNA helicase RecG
LFRLCENVTDLPNQGFFPQMSQTAAIDGRGYQGGERSERRGLLGDRLEMAMQVLVRDRSGVREGECSVGSEEHGDGLAELAERRLDGIGHIEDAREGHPELVHERPRLCSRVQDVDAEELHPVSELVMRGHEARHLFATRRAPRPPEVDHDRRALELPQQSPERVWIGRGKHVGERRQQGGLGSVLCGDGPGGGIRRRFASARSEKREPSDEGREQSGSHAGMVEPFSDVPASPSVLALETSVLLVDRKLATRRTGLREKGDEAHIVLAGMGIRTVGELIRHYPRRYIDRSAVERIGELRIGQQATVIARVHKTTKRLTRRRQSMVTITITDGTGYLDLTFFNQPWAAGIYKEGLEVAVSGTVTRYRGRLQLGNQEAEILGSDERDLVHTGRITPVHRASEGITTRTIRELVFSALEKLPPIADPMPSELIESERLQDLDTALRRVHFPEDAEQLAQAVERLKFDELFTLELGVAFRKHRLESERTGVAHRGEGELTDRLLATTPFEPTKAQIRAIEEVGGAMAARRPMNVLLQGDVGSGKTLVAVHAALVAIQSGHQAAIMAPTEVLAGQHARSVAVLLAGVGGVNFLDKAPAAAKAPEGQRSLLDPLEGPPSDPSSEALTYALLTSAVTGKDRTRILAGIADGTVDLVIGTHALVQESVSFHDLSLAVVDEQHRFGLHQRMALKGKGDGEIDVLIMTATPIPRTLALTYYGDLDVVVLDEMPKGRKPIGTAAARSDAERAAAYDLVRREVRAGRQAFVVCAAIDEGNRTQVRAAEAEAERLATKIFPDLRVELLHGRMRPKDKERVMEDFRSGHADVLISTTVIEVGVDVPNATVMLIENAERFGLAQLHQLRGRIGRGAHVSYCVLFDESEETNLEARARIEAMTRTTDGFELADEDLRLRGEGTLFDTKQSGMPDLKLARLADDLDLVKRARARAFAHIKEDPSLERHPRLFDELRDRFEDSIAWLFSA